MPIKHSALRHMRKARKSQARNHAIRAELKTLTKQLLILLREGKLSEAKACVRLLAKRYDNAASKGIIHRNTAARCKSRLARHLNRISAAKPST